MKGEIADQVENVSVGYDVDGWSAVLSFGFTRGTIGLDQEVVRHLE